MMKRNLAFGLGFGTIGLVCAGYLLILGSYLLDQSSEVDSEGMVNLTFWFLLPVAIVAFGLRAGRRNPQAAGLIELILGVLAFTVSLILLIPNFNAVINQGLVVKDMVLTALGAGALLLVSGILFTALAFKPEA